MHVAFIKPQGNFVSHDSYWTATRTSAGPRVWPDRGEAWEVHAEALPYVTVIKPSMDDASSTQHGRRGTGGGPLQGVS